MLLVTLGVPGSASTWIFNVCRTLLIAANARSVSLSSDDGLDVLDNIPIGAGHVLLKAHGLDLRLLRLMELTEAKVIISTRDVRDAATSLIERFDISFEDAVRDISRSTVSIAMLPEEQRRLLLEYETGFTKAVSTVQRIAEFMDLTIPESTLSAVKDAYDIDSLRALSIDRNGDRHSPDTQWHPNHFGDGLTGKWGRRLNPAQSRALPAATYRPEVGKMRRGFRLSWAACLFRFDPEVSHGDAGRILADGSERVVVYGPYLNLPPGLWRVVVHARSHVALRVDVYSSFSSRGCIAEIEIDEWPDSGQVTLTFEHCDHFEPIEVRLHTRDGIGGAIKFSHVDLTWLGEPSAPPMSSVPMVATTSPG